jgi:poly-beta-hydroxyalkanoate depolymerase
MLAAVVMYEQAELRDMPRRMHLLGCAIDAERDPLLPLQ